MSQKDIDFQKTEHLSISSDHLKILAASAFASAAELSS